MNAEKDKLAKDMTENSVASAIEKNKSAFWIILLKARIQYKLGWLDKAIITTKESESYAATAKNTDYVQLAKVFGDARVSSCCAGPDKPVHSEMRVSVGTTHIPIPLTAGRGPTCIRMEHPLIVTDPKSRVAC